MSLSFTVIRRSTAITLAVALSGLFALMFSTWTSSASAAPYPPKAGCTVSTTTANVGPGDNVTLVGSGFAASQTVSLSVPSASAALGSVTTTGSGTFRTSFTWPASVNGSSALIQASAPSTSCSFTLINSHSSTPQPPSSSSGTGGLSSTGFATLTATTIAIVLIGAGAMFLGLARRKRV